MDNKAVHIEEIPVTNGHPRIRRLRSIGPYLIGTLEDTDEDVILAEVVDNGKPATLQQRVHRKAKEKQHTNAADAQSREFRETYTPGTP